MGRLTGLQNISSTAELNISTQSKGRLGRSISGEKILPKREPIKVSLGDVAREIPSATAQIASGFANTFIPAITNFFKTTGSIFGEGLAYAIDPEVRRQFKAGNLDVLPIISSTTTADLAKTTIAAGIETAVYRSFPKIVQMTLLPRGGVGALQGMGFAIGEGLANDKSPEQIIKSLPAFGVLGSTVGVATPYLLPLLKAEMKVLPKEIRNVFKGLAREVKDIRPPKPKAPFQPTKQLRAPEERLLLGPGTPETIALSAPREKLLLQAGIKPTRDPIKTPIYKKLKITKNTKLERGDIISIEDVDKFVVIGIKRQRVTPRGKEQIVELKDLSGNTFEESVRDLVGSTQIKKVGERTIVPPKKPVQPISKVAPETIKEKPITKLEQKPTPKETPIFTETRETKVPREQLPVGEGKTKVSRLEARIKGVLDEVTPEKADEAGIVTYNQMNKAEQIKAASKYVETNPDEALAVLKGDKPAPKGLLHNSIAIALEKKAELGADANLATKLAAFICSALFIWL